MLSREAKKYKSAICVIKDGKSANVLRLMALMSLGVKCGETVTVTIEGEDEETVAPLVEECFKANL